MADAASSLHADLVDAPKLASVVARRIEDEVAALGWPTGEVLGSESDLVESFGVSRAVFREAVRIVEHTGVATMRRGPGGGLVVGEPSAGAVAMAAGIWISHAGVGLDQMFDVRRPLLMAAVRLAARHHRPEDVAALREVLVGYRGHDFQPRQLVEAEVEIARMGGNPVFELFIRVLGDLGVHQMETGHSTLAKEVTAADRLRHLEGYLEMLDHIDDGDVAASAEMMDRLIASARRRVNRAPADRRRRRRPIAAASKGKLAEQVAGAIREDIERAGWPVGEVLGSESELIERYDVSRAILREGVRILEHHGAVRTKRGPNGGVIVNAPDIRAIVRSALLVLQHRGVTRANLDEARSAIEVAAVRRAATRRDDAAIARLTAGLAGEADHESRRFDFYDVHRLIAETTQNPAFSLFVDVMTELVPTYVIPEYRTRDGEARLAGVVHHAHVGIVEAICAGDEEAATRRMARHLEAAVSVLTEGPAGGR